MSGLPLGVCVSVYVRVCVRVCCARVRVRVRVASLLHTHVAGAEELVQVACSWLQRGQRAELQAQGVALESLPAAELQALDSTAVARILLVQRSWENTLARYASWTTGQRLQCYAASHRAAALSVAAQPCCCKGLWRSPPSGLLAFSHTGL